MQNTQPPAKLSPAKKQKSPPKTSDEPIPRASLVRATTIARGMPVAGLIALPGRGKTQKEECRILVLVWKIRSVRSVLLGGDKGVSTPEAFLLSLRRS